MAVISRGGRVAVLGGRSRARLRGDRGRWRVSVRIILHISGFLLRGHDASGRYSLTAVAALPLQPSRKRKLWQNI